MVRPRDLLLYVDDEEQALKYFRLTFAKDYEVLTARSADEAWPLIDRHADQLAVIISDQRMPGRSGVELLTATKERCPRTVRLLTTAYSELSSAIDAVNEGEIYAYVTKPWKLDELKVVVRQALQLHRLHCERDALLAEKLGVVQQMLLIDRRRIVGVALAGLSGQTQRPLAAAAAWLRDREQAFGLPARSAGDAHDLWPTVLAQSRDCAVLAGQLSTWLTEVRGTPAETDVAAVIAETAQGITGTTVLNQSATHLAVDRGYLAAGFKELLRLLRDRLGGPDACAEVQVRSPQADIIRLRVCGDADPTVVPDAAGLAGYLAIHHHHGSIAVPAWSSAGGEVIVTLGGSSDDGLGTFLAQLAESEA